MKSFLEQLTDICYKLEQAGADTMELNKLIDDTYDYEKTAEGYRCQLKDRGICLALMGADHDCYDSFDGCLLRKLGLYSCDEIGEIVDQEMCKSCNSDMDCGCCEYVQNGSAPHNCGVCGHLKLEISGVGYYCVPPETSVEEQERIKKEAAENPGDYFHC